MCISMGCGNTTAVGEQKTERYIFEEDSLEWEINVLGTSDKQKWMFALTEEKGYEVLVRYPDRVYYVVGDQDPYHQLEIAETDNGYRGQAIISMEDQAWLPLTSELGQNWSTRSRSTIVRTMRAAPASSLADSLTMSIVNSGSCTGKQTINNCAS